jgi:circadian clock protein KaiA
LYPSLSTCIFIAQDALAQAVHQTLSLPDDAAASENHYLVKPVHSIEQFYALVEQEKQQLDCLILQNTADLTHLTNWLYGQAILLPSVIIYDPAIPAYSPLPAQEGAPPLMQLMQSFLYHTAEVRITADQLPTLDHAIEQAIAQFIRLSPSCRLSNAPPDETNHGSSTDNFLLSQQRRLTEKLTERLGYLGVYYKRNPHNFFRYLSPDQKQETIEQFKQTYREIILCYFENDGTLNQQIDDFVNTAFFADVAVSQIVEIHMDLMDEFSKQLKLEGRSEDVLLDYRLTLIDVIAHLCELYRRSVPKENPIER